MSITIPSTSQYQLWSIEKIRPYSDNPRINDDVVDKMILMLKRHGFRLPLIVKRDGELIDGHLRLKAAIKLGMKRVPVLIVAKDLTPNEVRAMRLSINRISEDAEWDPELLIKELGIMAETGMSESEIATLTSFELTEVEAFLEPEDDESDDDDNADADESSTPAAVKGETDILAPSGDSEFLTGESPVMDFRDEVEFDQVGALGFPSIRADRLLDIPAPTCWAGVQYTKGKAPYLYSYSVDSTIGLPWEKTVVAAYTADHKFERMWSHTADVAKRFKNLGIKGVVTPDFSCFRGWPRVRRVFNIYRSRWIGRYFQEIGIPVIVNVSGTEADLDVMFDGLPKGCPMCIQLQGRFTKAEAKAEAKIITAVLDFKPRRLWVLAPDDRKLMFPMLRDKANVEFIVPRIVARRQRPE